MFSKGIVGGVIILLIIIFGMFFFVSIFSLDKVDISEDRTVKDTAYDSIKTINATRFYQDGAHTLTGGIELPTPCDLLSWDVVVAESYPEQVIIDFYVSKHSDACVQVVTLQKFHITFNASEIAKIRTTLESKPINLVITEGVSTEDAVLFEPFLSH
jgi:hypothetical protein